MGVEFAFLLLFLTFMKASEDVTVFTIAITVIITTSSESLLFTVSNTVTDDKLDDPRCLFAGVYTFVKNCGPGEVLF